jgi:2-methylcitrate dehydratase
MKAGSVWDGVSVSGLVAPAMAGRLFGLDAGRLAHAIALGAARAPTPVAVREGRISAAKSIANALIAQSGMQATLLAAHGITGPLDVFEADRGLNAVFSRKAAGDILAAPMPADPFAGNRVAIKAYPCFAGAQCAVAAAIALNRKLDGDIDRLAGDIAVVLADLAIVRRQISDPGRIAPRSREAADHSLHFLIAVAVMDGTLGLGQFEAERWNDPKVRALMTRLQMIPDAGLARRGDAYPCALRAVGRDGHAYEAEILAPPGFSSDGPDASVVVEKFSRVTDLVLTADRRDRIIETVMELDSSPCCEGLFGALSSDQG